MTEDVTGRARRALLAATAPIAPLLIIASALSMPPRHHHRLQGPQPRVAGHRLPAP
jgi:hypothetical protein